MGGKITKERQDYRNMKQRCYDTTTSYYHRYGGRGVKVCNEWIDDFEAFKLWHKKTYIKNMTLDRKDNSKEYSPSNCRWVSMKIQSQNREVKGKIHSLSIDEQSDMLELYDNTKISQSELSRITNIPRTSIQALIYECK